MASAASAIAQLNHYLANIVQQIVNPLMALMAAMAFAVFIWGVFLFISGAADPKKRETGRKSLIWGLVGLVIVFGAYGIINLVLGAFGLPPISH